MGRGLDLVCLLLCVCVCRYVGVFLCVDMWRVYVDVGVSVAVCMCRYVWGCVFV